MFSSICRKGILFLGKHCGIEILERDIKGLDMGLGYFDIAHLGDCNIGL